MPLFKTISEIRKYVPVDENMHFESFKPFVEEAELMYVKQLLGAYYMVLLTDYTDNTNADGTDTGMQQTSIDIIPFVQRTLAYYSAYQSLAHIGVSLGDMGVQEQFGSNSRPAPRWKSRELQQQYINQADKHADALLTYLEQNSSETFYQAWFEDPEANTQLSGLIVRSTEIASRYVDIHESRRVFLRMKKRIKEIELNEIKRIVCTDQYEALVTQIKEGTLTTANTELVSMLEPYISKKALYLTIPSIRISITDEGITVHSTTDGVVLKASANREDIKALMMNLKEGEFGYVNDLAKIDQFIIDNIADYPLIEASPCYTSKETTPPKYQADNDPCNKHFSI